MTTMKILPAVSALVMVVGLAFASGLAPLSLTTGGGLNGGGINGVALTIGGQPLDNVLYFSGGACATATDGGVGCVSGLTVHVWVIGPAGSLVGQTSVVTGTGGYFSSSVDFTGAATGSYEVFGSLCGVQQSCGDPIGVADFSVTAVTATVSGTVTTLMEETGTLTVSCSGTVAVLGQSQSCQSLDPTQTYNQGSAVTASARAHASYLGIALFVIGSVGLYAGSRHGRPKKGSE